MATPVNGDKIYNGARDNASGTAMVLEIAREFKKVQPPPKRSILFVAVTAEEQGLLGSEYYAKFPLYPLAKTLANINMDEINVWGRTKDITIIGLGASDLDDYAAGRGGRAGPHADAGLRAGKGLLLPVGSLQLREGRRARRSIPTPAWTSSASPPSYGKQKRDEWTEKFYHQPTDEVQPWWDLSGAAEDGKLFFAVGYRVANAATFPEWKPGNEFRAIREKSLK